MKGIMNSGQPGSSEKMDVAAERAAVVVASPTVTLNPTGDAPLAALVEFETNDTTKAALTVSDGSETRTIYFDDFATDHALPLFGLKPDTAYTIDVALHGIGRGYRSRGFGS
jgi:hypothetical protein